VIAGYTVRQFKELIGVERLGNLLGRAAGAGRPAHPRRHRAPGEPAATPGPGRRSILTAGRS
jgi:hypothetical protein